jgi:hypothetical protein
MDISMNKTQEAIKEEKQSFENENLTVADAVWVATALLHEEHPDAEGFSTEEIVSRVQWLRLTRGGQKTIWQHVNQHCVANRKPQPNRSRMLYALGKGVRRLFREGDRGVSEREGAPTHPQWSGLPQKYRYLEHWYEEWSRPIRSAEEDPLLMLVGSGADIWKHTHADEFVASLREGWDR